MTGRPSGVILLQDSDSLVGALRPILAGPAVLVGVGRAEQGDDGFGPAVVASLRGRTSLPLIDAGAVPENFLVPIASLKPRKVLFLDAADYGAEPGALALLEMDDVGSPGTHKPSLRLVKEFLEQQASARSYLLAVQPCKGGGAGLSGAVRAAAAAVAGAVVILRPAPGRANPPHGVVRDSRDREGGTPGQ